jgi:hypothetical protein
MSLRARFPRIRRNPQTIFNPTVILDALKEGFAHPPAPLSLNKAQALLVDGSPILHEVEKIALRKELESEEFWTKYLRGSQNFGRGCRARCLL